MLKLFHSLGKYITLMQRVISKPKNSSLFRKQLLLELEKVGINSLWLVIIISLFVGAVVAIQTKYNIESPLIPMYLVGVWLLNLVL